MAAAHRVHVRLPTYCHASVLRAPQDRGGTGHAPSRVNNEFLIEAPHEILISGILAHRGRNKTIRVEAPTGPFKRTFSAIRMCERGVGGRHRDVCFAKVGFHTHIRESGK